MIQINTENKLEMQALLS